MDAPARNRNEWLDAALLSAIAERDGAAFAVFYRKLLMSLRRGRVEARARHRLGFQAVALEDDDLDRLERVALGGGGRLVQLLEDLPEDERFAVGSRVIDERPYGEIAGRLRCSKLVVRKRVSRGLARMREQVKETG